MLKHNSKEDGVSFLKELSAQQGTEKHNVYAGRIHRELWEQESPFGRKNCTG